VKQAVTNKTPAAAANISCNDRLCFTLFLAIALHVTLIIGISFEREQIRSSIDVTLTRSPSPTAPDKADYIADNNQAGGGLRAEAAQPSATHAHQQPHQAPAILQTDATSRPKQPPSKQQRSPVVTQAKANQLAQKHATTAALQPTDLLEEEVFTQKQASKAISQSAELDIPQQSLTKNRTLKVNSLAALKALDADYVKQWINTIERAGQRHYPSEALRKKINGKLSLKVILLADGSIAELKIIRSSGHQILDHAALQIVRHAAPFAPFSAQMKKHYEQLEITRIWRFTQENKHINLSGARL